MKTKSCILSAFYILFIILSGIYVSAYQSNNETTLYVSDSFVVVINSSGQFNYTYYYLNNQLLGAKAPDGTKTYYHSDHLGSTTLVTNQSGDIVEENFYEPFGQIYSGEEENRYLYTGQELDQDTDLYYYGARYYDPSKNQFVQPDPLIQDIYTPADLNRYAYVRNNPYKYTDPTGNVAIAIPVIVYTVIEAGIDVASLGYSIYVLAGDHKSAVNWVAVAADVQDTLSGPISNPGPSGPIIRGSARAAIEFEKKLAEEAIEQSAFEGLKDFEDSLKSNDDSRGVRTGGGSSILVNSNVEVRNLVDSRVSSLIQPVQRSSDRNNNKPISSSTTYDKKASTNNQDSKKPWWRNWWSKTQNKPSKNKDK